MQIEQVKKEGATIRLSKEELVILNNALNEVCNGLDLDEFSTRMGTQIENVDELLSQIRKVIDTME